MNFHISFEDTESSRQYGLENDRNGGEGWIVADTYFSRDGKWPTQRLESCLHLFV